MCYRTYWAGLPTSLGLPMCWLWLRVESGWWMERGWWKEMAWGGAVRWNLTGMFFMNYRVLGASKRGDLFLYKQALQDTRLVCAWLKGQLPVPDSYPRIWL